MNASNNTQKVLNTSTISNTSSNARRLSYLKPPQLETKMPTFLQQTRVSLHIPKHDNDLPDYSNFPVPIDDDQRSIRSLGQLAGLDSPNSPARMPGVVRKDTLLSNKNSKRASIAASQLGRISNTETIDVFQQHQELANLQRYEKLEQFLENKWFNLALMLATIEALFGQDFSDLVFPKQAQIVFDCLAFVSISIFLIEIIINWIAKKEYRWSFFFWLDLISTASIVLDVSFIPSSAIDNQANSTQIARAGRVSKVGARAGRAVRAFRLLRVAKLYKSVRNSELLDTQNAISGISHNRSPSLQSLTNLVDHIAKYKRNGGHSASPSPVVSRRGSIGAGIEPKKNKSMTMSFKGPGELEKKLAQVPGVSEEEKAPLSDHTPHFPRRLSQFAVMHHKDSADSIAASTTVTKPQQVKLNTSKNLKSSFTMSLSKKNGFSSTGENAPKESRVGKTIADNTTKKVIFIVILVLLAVPLLSADSWISTPRSYIEDVAMIKAMWMNDTIERSDIDFIIHDVVFRHLHSHTPILYIRTPNGTVVYQAETDYKSLRSSAVDEIGHDDYPPFMLLVADLRLENKVTDGTNIGRTIFICLILGFGAWLFSKDTNNLVLRPLERMLEKVNRIAVAPLSAKREHLMEETHDKETVVLENALTKIGTLLALGFGDAGAGIIAQNIAHHGDMDPMLAGEKVMAIFGFCDIRNFTDATEVLQEDVMVFVNSIAKIVHDKVDKYGGSANKNIGDAFLLVWKFPYSEVEELEDDLQLKNTDLVSGMSDLSLFSFLKIFARVNQSYVLRKYRKNEKLTQRMPNYRVRMGFGLHVGWAIEGAIGSEYKIDASYLSPNVNIASRLEAATKQYGVPLLISSDLFVLFSEEVQKYCRKLDVVTVKGSQTPLTLYSVDLDATGLRDKGPSKRSRKERMSRHEIKKQKLLEMIWEGRLSTHLMFEKDKDLKLMMKKGFEGEFRQIWDEGLDHYIQGDWKKARFAFDKCLVLREEDGPSKTLLNHMKTTGYRAPEDWKGFRELTEK